MIVELHGTDLPCGISCADAQRAGHKSFLELGAHAVATSITFG